MRKEIIVLVTLKISFTLKNSLSTTLEYQRYIMIYKLINSNVGKGKINQYFSKIKTL